MAPVTLEAMAYLKCTCVTPSWALQLDLATLPGIEKFKHLTLYSVVSIVAQ